MANVSYHDNVSLPLFAVSYQNSNGFNIRPGRTTATSTNNSCSGRVWMHSTGNEINYYIYPVSSTSSSSPDYTPSPNSTYSAFYDEWKDYFNDIPDPSDLTCTDWTYRIPIKPINANWASALSYEIYPRDAEFLCRSSVSISSVMSVNTTRNYLNIATGTVSGTVEVPDSGGSGGSIDTTDISNSILMIPATAIVLAFFSCIYKIFINRRLRG